MAHNEAISQKAAVEQLEASHACDVITTEKAAEIADAFDVDLDEAPTAQISDVVPILFGDDGEGIAVTDLVVEIVRQIGEEPDLPEFDGVGFTARARYSQNLSILYDHVDIAIEHEPDINWEELEEFDGPELTFGEESFAAESDAEPSDEFEE